MACTESYKRKQSNLDYSYLRYNAKGNSAYFNNPLIFTTASSILDNFIAGDFIIGNGYDCCNCRMAESHATIAKSKIMVV
jgi:hypothetical protein